MKPLDISRLDQLKITGDLPSPRGAALAVMALTRRDDVTLNEIAHAIKVDPALVGRLVRAANSARTGTHRPIVSIQDALTVLGVAAVRGMVLSFALIDGYRSGRCQNFDYSGFWSHSLCRGVALQAICARTRVTSPEEAFSLGLLSRIGTLALATVFPAEYAMVLKTTATAGDAAVADEERRVFAMTRGELAAAMLLDWGVPTVLAEAVLHFEQPELANVADGSRQGQLLWALALARKVADICLSRDDRRRAMMAPLFLLGSRLAIPAEELTALCDRVVKEWREWAALLEVESAPVPPFDELTRPPPAPSMVPEPAAPGDGMRVLVVDDDPTIRAMLRGLLTRAGHELVEAQNGQQGFALAMEKRPHLMVVDWLMPEMDGITLTRMLRQTAVGRSIYLLVLTSLDDDEKLIEAFEAGVDDFMAKPLKPRVLAARLRAGQRVVGLQHEIERDREEIRRFAAELALTNRRLQEAALTDPLTGFPNRRYAMERIEQEWSAAARSGRELSCMVIDVDAFKKINDTFGHDKGDDVLRKTAAALKRGLRAHDVIARLGGDEFLVISPDTALPAAMACAERVRLSVEKALLTIGTQSLRSTVSIGVASRDGTTQTADAMIKLADQGAYLAKQAGRNRVATPQAVTT